VPLKYFKILVILNKFIIKGNIWGEH